MNFFIFIACLILVLFNNNALAIISGIESSDDFLVSVFKIGKKNGSSICTGVLFEPNKIITAFHCVISRSKEELTLTNSYCREASGCGEFKIRNVLVSSHANLVYERNDIFDHNENMVSELNLLNYLKNDDFAIIVLDKNLKLATTPLISTDVITPSNSSFVGALTLIAGYGYYSPEGTLLENALYGTKHHDYFIVDKFDENYFSVHKNSISSIARGDSGSGLMIDIHGKYFIYGILSGYGSIYGLFSSLKGVFTLQRLHGYAIPVSTDSLSKYQLEEHKPPKKFNLVQEI